MKWILFIFALSGVAFGQYYQPLSPVASPFLTVDMNNNSQWPDGGTNPLVRMNCFRMWDTPGASGWAQIETSAGSYVYTTLDAVITRAMANGVNCMFYPLNRTPGFYSSNNADITCGYYASLGSGTVNTAGTAVTRVSGTNFSNTWTTIIINGVLYTFTFISSSSGTLGSSAGTQTGVGFDAPSTNAVSKAGQCDMPTDINTDGSGTNLHYKNWVAAVATHIKTTFPTLKVYYEFYNEPDTCKFFNSDTATQASCSGTGTIAELQRWEWDVYCIVKGTPNNNPFIGGQSCATSQGLVTSVTLAGAVDSTATVLMGSYHGAPFSYNLAQNFLYCNHPTVPTNCPGASGALYTDGINFHFKYGGKPCVQGDATTVMEASVDTWIAGLVAILQPNELHKPFYNTEGGYAAGGWVDGTVTSGVPTCNYLSEPLMESSYMARNNIYQAWRGVTNAVFYDWTLSGGNFGLGGVNDSTHLADKAYDTSGQWINGATGMLCLTTPPGTAHAGLFTYTCTFRNAQGQPKAMIWDNSQTCSSGTCTTTNQVVAPTYVSYSKLDGSAPVTIVSHTVPVGIQPILLNAVASSGIGGVTIKGLKASIGAPSGPPFYPLTTSSQATYTLTTPWNAASLFNSTTHSALNPTSDCITLMTDASATAIDNISTSNFSYSGGWNQPMISLLNHYYMYRSSGMHVLQMDASGPCIQTVGSENSTLAISGPSLFSRAHDSVIHTLVNTDVLTDYTITVYPTTTTSTLFDIRNCPGPIGQGTDPFSGGTLSVSLDDTTFGFSGSWYGGQGTGRWGMAIKPGTGCSVIDYATGNWYHYANTNGGRQVNSATVAAGHATFTMAATCPYTLGQVIDVDEPNLSSPATPNAFDGNWTVTTACSGGSTWTGTPNTIALPGGPSSNGWTAYVPDGTETVCTSSTYYSGNGTHDGQIQLDGKVLVMAGGCLDQLVAGGAAVWEIDTGNVGQLSGSLNHWSGHESSGVHKAVQNNNPSPNIRTVYPLTQGTLNAYTTIGTFPAMPGSVEIHGAWPNPVGALADSYPWILATATGTNYATPVYGQNELLGLFTDGTGVIKQFAPLYNSSTVSSGTQFGCNNAIGSVFQDGTGACWLSDVNLNLGLTSGGNQACAILCAKLE